MSRSMEETVKRATELGISLNKEEHHYFCTDNWYGEHKEDYNKTSDNTLEGNTLGNLRRFMEAIKHLPDNLSVVRWNEREFESIAVKQDVLKTQEDLEQEIKEKEDFMAKHEKWEREQYEALKRKFGGK